MAAKYKKRADGRYLIQIQTGIQENGKPKYKSIYAYTIRELEEKASTYRQELEKGIVVSENNLTVAQWSAKWLETYKSDIEYNTMEMYTNTIKKHIIPSLGYYKLKDLKSHHIQEVINKKASEGLTRTLEVIKLTLNQILDQAVKNEFIYKNPVIGVKMPKKEKPQKRALTEVEIEYVKNAILPLKEKIYILLLLYTGLRKGEALALTKNDIDLSAKTITVNKTLLFKPNQGEIKNSPKTDAGNRVVPIVDDLFAILVQYLSTLDTLIIFPSANKRLMSDGAFRSFWNKIINALNLVAGGTNGKIKSLAIASDITPHIFRHTFATSLYYAGVDIKTAQYLLGHTSIHVTMDIYTHLDSQSTATVNEKLNNYFSHKNQSVKNQSDSK